MGALSFIESLVFMQSLDGSWGGSFLATAILARIDLNPTENDGD